jgi:rod shape-determining protein MreD
MLIFYLILGFLLFFLQNLLPFSAQVHVDLLTLFMIFISLRVSFLVSVWFALILGISLDCYGFAPLGLQAAILLLAVVGVKILRRHLNFLYLIPQILGVAVITIMQALVMALLLHLLMPVPIIYPSVVRQGLLQVIVTSMSAPVVLALFSQLEKLWRRWLLIKTSYQY